MVLLKTLYETDFNLWLEKMANLLKTKQLDELDLENLIEEIEAMGRSEKRTLKSNLVRVFQHLLKWNYQKDKRTPSWGYSILEHSRRLKDAFEDSPSLTPYFDTVFDECYQEARKLASVETQLPLSTFPKINPFTKDDVLAVNPEDYLL